MSPIHLLLSAAVAQAAVPASPPAPPAAKDKGEKVICKTDSFVGSKIPRRICKTRSQWDHGREGAKDTMNDIGRGGDYLQFHPGG